MLSQAGELLGMVWGPTDLPAASASGDPVLYVGDLSRELAVSDKVLRISLDTEPDVANAVNDMENIVSYHRFNPGLWGDGNSLSKVVIV